DGRAKPGELFHPAGSPFETETSTTAKDVGNGHFFLLRVGFGCKFLTHEKIHVSFPALESSRLPENHHPDRRSDGLRCSDASARAESEQQVKHRRHRRGGQRCQ